MNQPGFFLSIEGGDGAGKSTQARLLAAALNERLPKGDVVSVRQPGGTALGEQLRALVLHGEEMSAEAEALLYAADRAEHVAEVIRPALQRGAVVICDRYIDSSIAYQVDGRGLALADVVAVNEFATGGLWPHLTIVLDVDPGIGRARLEGAPDRLERAGDEFHARVRTRYLALAHEHPQRYRLIDASGDPKAVHERVLAAVLPVVRAWSENEALRSSARSAP